MTSAGPKKGPLCAPARDIAFTFADRRGRARLRHIWRIARRPGNDPGRPDGLLCKATYRLTQGVALYYSFRIDGEQFAAEAMRQDERVGAIARSLIVEQGAVPSGL